MKVITIGRSSENDVPVSDPKVSRHHLQIVQHDNGSYTLSDFGSTNGTYVNGQRVYGEIILSPNDIVRIGDTTLRWNVYFKECVGRRPAIDIPEHDNLEFNNSSASESNTRTIVLSFVAILVVGVILVLAFVWMFNRGDNNTPEPRIYKNDIGSNVSVEANGEEIRVPIEDGKREVSNVENSSPSVYSDLDLSGEWVMEESDENGYGYFRLYLIKQNNGRTTGIYTCEVEDYDEGESLKDVSGENTIKEISKSDNPNMILVEFYSGSLGGQGTAYIIKYDDNNIGWKRLSDAGENVEYVVPPRARLKKVQ